MHNYFFLKFVMCCTSFWLTTYAIKSLITFLFHNTKATGCYDNECHWTTMSFSINTPVDIVNDNAKIIRNSASASFAKRNRKTPPTTSRHQQLSSSSSPFDRWDSMGGKEISAMTAVEKKSVLPRIIAPNASMRANRIRRVSSSDSNHAILSARRKHASEIRRLLTIINEEKNEDSNNDDERNTKTSSLFLPPKPVRRESPKMRGFRLQ